MYDYKYVKHEFFVWDIIFIFDNFLQGILVKLYFFFFNLKIEFWNWLFETPECVYKEMSDFKIGEICCC